MSPYQSKNLSDPVAASLSFAKFYHVKSTNDFVFNMHFRPTALKGTASAKKFGQMLKATLQEGGFFVQFTIVDTETLRSHRSGRGMPGSSRPRRHLQCLFCRTRQGLAGRHRQQDCPRHSWGDMKMAYVRYNPLHVGISVSNLENGIQWFEEMMGFTLREKSDYVPVGFRVAFLDNGGGFEVELFENRETKPAPEERLHPDTDSKTQGTKHIAFAVDDLDTELAYFRTKGIEPVMGPAKCFGLYVAFIHGPDKVLLELIEVKC